MQTTDAGDVIERLPLISVRGLLSPNRKTYLETADAIGQAARDIGFFRICDHGVPPEMIEDTYGAAAEFFNLPLEIKQKYYIGLSSNHRGYVPFTEKGDYPDEVHRSYEAFDLGLDLPHDDPDYLAGNGVLGPNVWPELAGFQQSVAAYYAKISALGRLVCAALEAHLRLPAGVMTEQMTKPVSQLRLLHYVRQAQTTNNKSVNMGAHTDYECLTLLHTRNKGLQVMTNDERWIDVPVDPLVFVVNIGDMLETWSNGVLRSTPHRVLNLSPERFSLPYFVATNYNTVVQPFPNLVEAGQKPKYAPLVAGKHLETMLQRDFPYLRHKTKQRAISTPAQTVGGHQNPFEKRLNTKT